MRTRIGLLAQPESMRSIVGATQSRANHAKSVMQGRSDLDNRVRRQSTPNQRSTITRIFLDGMYTHTGSPFLI